jgi:regulator of sigma D
MFYRPLSYVEFMIYDRILMDVAASDYGEVYLANKSLSYVRVTFNMILNCQDVSTNSLNFRKDCRTHFQ